MKNTFLLLLLALTISGLQAQSKSSSSEQTKQRQFLLQAGASITSFQDANFSTTNWNGKGGVLGFAFAKTSPKYIWQVGLDLSVSTSSASSHDGSGYIIDPVLYAGYLRRLNEHFLFGGRVDMLDFYLNKRRDLGNNSTYDLETTSLFASVRYENRLRGKNPIWVDFNLGLLNFNREGTSFAFSAPQAILEEGAFNYQNEAISNPFNAESSQLDFLTSYLNIRTAIGISLSERSSIRYEWQMRHFSQVKGYPTTTGLHLLKYSYALISK